jgi:hypothetical protein
MSYCKKHKRQIRGSGIGELTCGHCGQIGDAYCYQCAKELNACQLCGVSLAERREVNDDQ